MHTRYIALRRGLLALLEKADTYGYQLKLAPAARPGTRATRRRWRGHTEVLDALAAPQEVADLVADDERSWR